MGMPADPQAFVPRSGETSPWAAEAPVATEADRNQLDPLIRALGRAVERSASGPDRSAPRHRPD